eukprot:CAMPEP_0171075674 /NCGR_PEP_ID=MMETSP0766_2-20121228/12930_1 /TAXON_ID=439317 /ORGANISM="Gambierdiscus australes, Strain CAWD 149" /LENGTH=177 /DNA_ID=CAMNT_0011532571 /DNA_START=102 /DNA_END=635 /DNA_ORIENTATION=-
MALPLRATSKQSLGSCLGTEAAPRARPARRNTPEPLPPMHKLQSPSSELATAATTCSEPSSHARKRTTAPCTGNGGVTGSESLLKSKSKSLPSSVPHRRLVMRAAATAEAPARGTSSPRTKPAREAGARPARTSQRNNDPSNDAETKECGETAHTSATKFSCFAKTVKGRGGATAVS